MISTGYSIKVKDLTNGAHSQLKELVAGEEYDLGKAFGNIAFGETVAHGMFMEAPTNSLEQDFLH